ncbi:hypothetical protein [Stackebrandtia nassauensis]|uniref:Uncharacterized protein n=1 Tax=Stackebrandtia nassauensis (strain DSM 44728 / CIP 108903 / NRRL B-16338 / NBRC 102104 / LLR-40K-21) TaxID=446470 RepID=D3Q5V8_STANL|nr:hypothetical protein [Stackebrandtia nassauensis]ADD40257.1 hypothetical protein Snas_0543 [Stackebrandtia nassauensis DSM 44728]
MSQQPYDPAVTGGFTVADGFSVIPPKRPTAVTLASAIMLAIAGLSGLGALVLIVVEVLDNPDPGSVLQSVRFDLGLWLFLLAVGVAPCALLVRNGSDGGRLATFTLLGIATLSCFGNAMQTLVELSGSIDVAIVAVPLWLLAAALTVTPVVALASPAASRWFWEQRREVSIMDPAVAVPRPTMFTVGVAFVALTALLDIAAKAAYLALMFNTSGIDIATYYLGFFASSAAPLIAVLVATVGLAVRSDLARVLAFGACGFYVYSGLRSQIGLVTNLDMYAIDVWFVVTFALGLLAAVSSTVALVALYRPQVSLWLGQNRFGVEPAGSASGDVHQ